MSNYSLPPPLPTYHVLLEGEGLGQSLGNCKDDLLNVCMRHVEKMCKADLSRSFIERNHMENGKSPPMGGLQGPGGFLLGQFLLPGSGWHPSSWDLTVSSLPSHLRVFGQGLRDGTLLSRSCCPSYAAITWGLQGSIPGTG